MKRKNWIVSKKSGVRGSTPDNCLYCGEPIGREHKADCVCRYRTVVVNVSIDIVRTEVESWDTHDIEFHLNDGCFCVDNLLDEMANTSKRIGCLCNITECRVIREATLEDENNYKIWVDKL